MHHVAVALDDEFLGGFHGADLGNAPDVVPPQIQEHQVLCQLFFVRQKILFLRFVVFGGGAARTGASNGANGDLVAKDPDQDLGAGADHLKTAKVEVEHERRRIGASQRAIERKGLLRELLRPTLCGHHLKDVAGADIVLGLLHRRPYSRPW